MSSLTRTSSRLLADEVFIQVQPSLAAAIGLNEAIVLQQLHHWLHENEKSGRNIRDGRVWSYNTYAAWQRDAFPFWSESTVKRIFTNLENAGLVISTSQYNASKIDRTKWYTIDYRALEAVSHETDSSDDEANLTRPMGQDDPCQEVNVTRPIPEDSTDSAQNTTSPSAGADEADAHTQGRPSTGSRMATSDSRGSNKTDLPANGPAQLIVKTFCETLGIEKPVGYRKMVGQAQQLVKAGYTPEDVEQIIQWLLADPFWASKGIDLGTVLSKANAWQAAKRQPRRRRMASSRGGLVHG